MQYAWKCDPAIGECKFQVPSYISNVGIIPEIIKDKESYF